jgi:hypothetical protein
MNANQLPLNQPVVVAKTDTFRTTATRVNNDEVELVYHDQKTNDETLKILGRVDGASSELLSFDKVYWNVSVNGRPATEADLRDLFHKSGLAISIDPNKRAIAVTVR